MAESLATRSGTESYAFGPFRLVPARQLLLRDGQPVRIGGRALDILTVLVERPGETVSKRDLIVRVWPNLFVEDSNLKVNINALRRALGEGTGSPQYIATVVGRGYRFVLPVEILRLPDWATAPGPALAANHNLPTAATRIIGRQSAIETIGVELRESRLVSIVGPGGIGKTTVALAVAEESLGGPRDGVWLVDLSTLRDADLVANAIATIIGLPAHSANTLEALAHYVRDKDMLLILDSCEHVIDGAAACVDRIIATAGKVRVLATSREPLRLTGERVRRLPGLATPDETHALSASEALTFPAVQLFVDRATDRDETFALSDADAPTTAEICRRLDGLALAIELAATHVDTLGPRGLLRALDDRFALLENRRGGPERHHTLLATIDWSHALLSKHEQMLMRRLSVFAGAFSLEAACAVAIDDRLDGSAVIANLSRLVAKSLVAAEFRNTELEYRQLDSTRAYALEKLAEHDETEAARLRHAEYCIELLGVAKADIERLQRMAWLARYAGHVDDVRGALRWTFSNPATGAVGVRLTIAAIPFGKQMSLIEECRVAVERALDDSLAEYRSAHDELLLNLTLGATLLHSRGPLLKVKDVLSRALGIAEKLRDVDLTLECLRGLSEYELWTGDSRSAMAVAEKIRALEGHGQKSAAGDADAQAGSALSWLGALGAARHQLESIVHKPAISDTRPDAARFDFDQRLTSRGSLATVLWLQGFADQAVATARRQLEDAEASTYAVSLCYALLHGSAVIAMYVRDYEAAFGYVERGVEHATRHGLTIWQAMAIGPRIRLALYAGRPIDLPALRETLAEVRDGGFRMRYPNYLTNYGEALARQGDLEGGLDAINEAIALCTSSGQIVGIPEILRIKGNVIRFQAPRQWEIALGCYTESIELARRDHAPAWELRSAMSLVKLWRQHGGNAAAEDALASCFGHFTEGFWTGDLRQARALMDSRLE
ncbi:MAG: winged helix-turn-helix domain-containing protein [Devosia nanyangense]|uniref:Winged helix-turn-helix domain-containing protein n=1 Tax=Devosia nanyangense TaxID=1228055 RepID=A0A933L4J7_9HYPH|nr:winged helix-turn-helix domain-containing protein [Devosia nanyangense]